MQTAWLQAQQAQIRYSAATFRQLLDSLARPGKINQLEYPDFLGEPPLYYSGTAGQEITVNRYALSALLTLLDREVSVGVAANGQWLMQGDPVVRWLALRSGVPLAGPNEAAFAFFCDGTSGGLLAQLSLGTLLEPEASATAIYCVERLASETAHPEGLVLKLSGPGILGVKTIEVLGLGSLELELIQASRKGYPLGVDIYLVDAAGQCIGLPRTTRISN